jgi:rootletin
VADVDPEAIRLALREYVQNLANIERERDDCITENNLLKKNIAEVQEAHVRTEQRLSHLQKSLMETEEGRQTLVSIGTYKIMGTIKMYSSGF